VTARGVSCSAVRAWVVKFTHVKIKGPGQQGLGQTLKGPAGYKCHSISEAVSGDDLVYAGVCLHPPHNNPFFGWVTVSNGRALKDVPRHATGVTTTM